MWIVCQLLLFSLVRDLLPRRPDLKLVLMSATLDEDRFSHYMNDCPIVNVPGSSFPVESLYLEEVLKITRFMDKKQGKKRRSNTLQAKTQNSSARSPSNHQLISVESVEKIFEDAFLHGSDECFVRLIDCMQKIYEFSQTGVQCELSINFRHRLTGMTALVIVCARHRADLLYQLLQWGADPSIIVDGKSAIDWAVMSNNALDSDGSSVKAITQMLELHQLVSQMLSTNLEGAKNDFTRAISPAISPAISWNEQDEQLVAEYLSSVRDDGVDLNLIFDLICHINETKDPSGAILVFLPGWDEISKLKYSLEQSSANLHILPLHSMISGHVSIVCLFFWL